MKRTFRTPVFPPYILTFILCFVLYGTEPATAKSENKTEISSRQGQRYFWGLLPKGTKAPSCYSCHYYHTADTINWNPSALEIALKYKDKDEKELEEALFTPMGKFLSEAHTDIDIPQEAIPELKVFLDQLADHGVPPEKPSINRLLLFLAIGVLLTIGLIDLIWIHKVPKLLMVIILLGGLGYQLKMIYDEATRLGRSQNYAPDQPVKFSHQIHAGQNKIDCYFCHHTADASKSANFPSPTLCLNCHILVREGSRSGKFEIDKIYQAVESKKPIQWIRIHQLPDHVFFAHAQHYGVAQLECSECHGDVKEMHILKQENDLSMGWCLDCHRTRRVQFTENDYYKIYDRYHKELQQTQRDSILATDIGAQDCMKCHY